MSYDLEKTAFRLDDIAGQLQRWIDFNKNDRDREGLETFPETYIISPPVWPTHGTIKVWVETLKEAEVIIKEKL